MSLAPHARRAIAWTAALAALAAVFGLYTHPQVAVLLAEQIWACFGG